MKKLFPCILVLTLVLSLFAGCGSDAAETAVTTAVPEASVQLTEAPSTGAAREPVCVTVSTVDELLAALGSDTEITMAAGTYDLTTASDYGSSEVGPAYFWNPTHDGYELVIRNLTSLTIQGSGMDSTEIVTVPRLSNVIVLDHCQNIRLEGVTVGHTEGGEMCNGSVLKLVDTDYADIASCGLFGCGTIAVDLHASNFINVTQCDLYECSYAGILAYGSNDLTVTDCQIHDLGSEESSTASAAFLLENCTGVTLNGCTVADSLLMCLLDFSNVGEIRVENCSFTGNRTVSGGFRFFSCEPIFGDNTFENNEVRIWYADDSVPAVDDQGTAITKDMLQRAPAATEQQKADRKQVHVSNVDEFLAAIASDTEIILDAELYDLSTASGYGKDKTDAYFWSEEFDGPELVISGISNFAISSDGDYNAHTISVDPRYADVLAFQHCSNIELSGFTAGHTKEPGSCAGGVLYFEDSDNVTVDNCGLYGCGIIGVQANYCSAINVTNCEIYECSQGGISMYNISGVNIDGCTFRDLDGFDINLQRCEDAMVDGKPYTNQ